MSNQQQSLQTSLHQGGSVAQQSQPVHRLSRLEKERRRQILQDNSVLLKKMIQIMNRKQNKEVGVPRVGKSIQTQWTAGQQNQNDNDSLEDLE